MNRYEYLAVAIIAAGITSSVYGYSLWSNNTDNGAKKTRKSLSINSTSDFNKRTSEQNQCYVSSATTCNGKSMSKYYWSNDPSAYWGSVNKSMDNNTTWSAPQQAVTAQLPSSSGSGYNSYGSNTTHSYQQPTTQSYGSNSQTQTTTPPANQNYNSGAVVPNQGSSSQSNNSGGFIIS